MNQVQFTRQIQNLEIGILCSFSSLSHMLSLFKITIGSVGVMCRICINHTYLIVGFFFNSLIVIFKNKRIGKGS